MRKLILPLILAVPTLALAENIREYKWEDHKPVLAMGSVSGFFSQAVAVDGVTEVPLYDCGPTRHCVKANMGEQQIMLEISLGDSYVALSEATAGKVKKKKLARHGVRDVATVDFQIGDAAFDGVKVFADYAGPADGKIGFGAFPGLAVAVLPSKGVVKLAPAGTDLSGDVAGGTTVPYLREDVGVVKDGGRFRVSPKPFVLSGALGGQTVGVYLHSNGPGGEIVSDAVSGDPALVDGLRRYHALKIDLGGAVVDAVAVEAPTADELHVQHQVRLGAAVTGFWDYAYDPAAGTFTFKAIETATRLDTKEADLEEALEGLEPPEVAEGEEAPPALEGEALAGAHVAVSNAYARLGDWDKALEHATLAADADPESCSYQYGLGDALVQAGRATEARGAYVRAAELYAPWAELSLPERQAYDEEKAEDPELYEGPRSQSHSCHTAWGEVARIDLDAGDYESVVGLYGEHFDLDADLALVAGLALLQQGRADEAEAALRQYARLQPTSPEAFSALGLLNEHKGRPQDAQAAYLRSRDGLGYARVAPESTDLRLIAEITGDPGTWLAYAMQLHASGQDATDAGKSAVAAYEHAMILDSDPELEGALALALVLSGDVDRGVALGEQVVATWPGIGSAHLALAWGADSAEHLALAKSDSKLATVWAL